jgi:hypothetical protein
VWLNLPEEQKCYTFDIGLWTPPPPGIWDIAMEWFGISEKPQESATARVLGIGAPRETIEDGKSEVTVPTEEEENATELVKSLPNESIVELATENKQQSTPLHQNRRSRHGSRRRARA